MTTVTGPVDEVLTLAQELIRIDTTNTGDPATSAGERVAAEYVAQKLAGVGFEPTYVESGGPKRGNVIARLSGVDPSRGALLVHGHLDVVPADPTEWTVHPFAGEVVGGYLWGRGAVDMKHMVAMTLAVARHFKRTGFVPPRDLIFAYLADEEHGGFQGARWLVDNRPDLFEGATEAISEVGGFSVTLPDGRRAYPIQTGEKGAMWLRLSARGTAGHGSLPQPDNPIAKLASAVARLQAHEFPEVMTDSVGGFLSGLGMSPELLPPGSGLARMVRAALRDTANVTMFDAGYKANVVPSTARATVDGRFLPGREEAFKQELLAVLGPDIEYEWDTLPAVEAPFEGRLAERMAAAISAEDPGARVLPYLLPAATDAKSFARLGIRSYGFAPLRLPPELDFAALFHGIDERVPVDALEFGTRVLERLLRDC